MAHNDKSTPPPVDPRPGKQPGYAESEPRDKEDARDPRPQRPPNPDAGGMERNPEGNPGAADD